MIVNDFRLFCCTRQEELRLWEFAGDIVHLEFYPCQLDKERKREREN